MGQSGGPCVNRPLKNNLVGDQVAAIELQDLRSDPQYQSWVKTAQLYGAALPDCSAVLPETQSSSGKSPRVLTIRIDRSYHRELTEALKAAYDALATGDMLVLDIPKGIERDLLSRLLFVAGFDRPLVWAGRKVLETENRRSKVSWLLPSRRLALGRRSFRGST